MKPRQETQAEQAPGCFNTNGSWNPNGTPGPQHKTHAGVVGLARTRRNHPDLPPKDIAGYVVGAGLQDAFPNLGQWDSCDNWLVAGMTNSAERLVGCAGGATIPNPVGVIPPVTPDIAAILSAVSGYPVAEISAAPAGTPDTATPPSPSA